MFSPNCQVYVEEASVFNLLCHPPKGLAPLPLPPQAQFCSGSCEPDGLVTSSSHPGQGSWLSCPRLPVSNQCPQSLHKLSNAWSRRAPKPPHAHQPWGHHSRPDAAQTRTGAPSPPVGSTSPQDAQALQPLWHCRGQISTKTPSSLLFLACGPFPLDNTMLGAAPPWAALGFWSPFSALAPKPRRRWQGPSTHRKAGDAALKVTRRGSPGNKDQGRRDRNLTQGIRLPGSSTQAGLDVGAPRTPSSTQGTRGGRQQTAGTTLTRILPLDTACRR